jgi:hypothetical protein
LSGIGRNWGAEFGGFSFLERRFGWGSIGSMAGPLHFSLSVSVAFRSGVEN